MRMVAEAKKMGTDQVEEVIKRGREMGLTVFPSLKLQASSPPGSERCGLLKWNHGAEVCIGEEGRAEWCYDFAHELVRQDKLAVLREMLQDYEADGIELDFMFDSYYFKQAEIEKNIALMNGFVAEIREMANAIGTRQGREIPIMARVDLEKEKNLSMGLDVETWLKEGSIDYVVGQDPYVLTETQPKPRWRCPTLLTQPVPQPTTGHPAASMMNGLGCQVLKCTMRSHRHLAGMAGLGCMMAICLGHSAKGNTRFCERSLILKFHARSDKRYLLQPREGEPDKPTTTPERQLPLELKEGETAAVNIWVADDLESAKNDSELRKPILTLRFSFFCIEDDIEFRFNGMALPWEEAEITDERALTIPVRLAGSMHLQAPLGMSAHWFRYKLELDNIKRGENTIEITAKHFTKTAGFARSLNGVEIQTRL